MRVVFVSNYFNHHQKPFSEAMDALTDHNYFFIQTQEMEEKRKAMGWGIKKPSYVINNYQSKRDFQYCQQLINTADVAIFGSAPYTLLKKRLRQGKLTFNYSERIFKKKAKRYLAFLRGLYIYLRFARRKNLYLLCASAYTAADYAKTFTFLDKGYKWGYFPEVKRYDDIDSLIKRKQKNSILFVSRLIPLKHPELVVRLAKKLKEQNYKFDLTIIGNGELEDQIKNQVAQEDLRDCVHIVGTMKPEQVREYMEAAEIFLFTSDRNEGWGAVLNESMNSGCAVVASHAIGSVPFLIKDKKNGLIFKDGNFDDLFYKVKGLLNNSAERSKIGKQAYATMIKQWNAENAAKRFLKLAEALLKGEKIPQLYTDGVCSKAEKLKDDWYND